MVSLCINFFHLLAREPNLEENCFIQTNSFMIFTCPNNPNNPVVVLHSAGRYISADRGCSIIRVIVRIQFYLTQGSGVIINIIPSIKCPRGFNFREKMS